MTENQEKVERVVKSIKSFVQAMLDDRKYDDCEASLAVDWHEENLKKELYSLFEEP